MALSPAARRELMEVPEEHAGVQLHGGYGYTTEYPIGKAWVDARISRIYAGTNEIMKELIGKTMGL